MICNAPSNEMAETVTCFYYKGLRGSTKATDQHHLDSSRAASRIQHLMTLRAAGEACERALLRHQVPCTSTTDPRQTD